jgi:hypothetical protein
MNRGVMMVYFLGNLINGHLVNRAHEDYIDTARVRQDAVYIGHVT